MRNRYLYLLCAAVFLLACDSNKEKTKAEQFAEFASVNIKGKEGGFHNENTLAYAPLKVSQVYFFF